MSAAAHDAHDGHDGSARSALARRDVREGGSWTALQRTKNDMLWYAATTTLAIARRLPLPLLRALGRSAGRVAHRVGRQARSRALANVAMALPALSEDARRDLVRLTYETLGELLGETVAFLREAGRPPPLALTDAARATIEEARREGRGVVFASAHLGPWENVARSLVAAGVPLVTVARESYDPRFTAVYDDLRRATGVRVVWRSSPTAPHQILRALRRGDVLGMPMDLRSRVPSIDVPFLGRSAPTAVGPARIALRSRAAVVVGTVARCPSAITETANGRRTVPLEVTATRVCTSDLSANAAGAAELTARINDELSRRVLALPQAWLWMHERWSS
jgi:KDO2-lipid IV(A) lauroyltransferase